MNRPEGWQIEHVVSIDIVFIVFSFGASWLPSQATQAKEVLDFRITMRCARTVLRRNDRPPWRTTLRDYRQLR